ncbi:Myosin family protein [Borrelia miyamotoi FR64b]|nr:Myosin family protein [Borrelia miyamotoi FR64b]
MVVSELNRISNNINKVFMDKGKKTIPMLFKIFMLLLHALLFGTAKRSATNYIINQLKIYIPKEDLSEGFNNEEDEIQLKKIKS